MTKDRKKRWGICKKATSLHMGLFLQEKYNIQVVLSGSYHDKPKGKGFISTLSAPRFNHISKKKTSQKKVYLSRRSLDSRVQQTVQ